MKVSDAMTKSVVIISSDASIMTAAKTMKENDIGAIPVQDEGVLKGILTDRDIVIRAIAEGKSPEHTGVSEIMTPELLAIYDDQDVSDAVKLMRDNKVRRILVMNRQKNPVGIISLGDLASHAGMSLVSEAMKGVAEPVHSR